MSLNPLNPTIKRLMSEFKQLQRSPEKDFVAAPLGQDLFVWHFTIRGAPDTAFAGGVYHGKIVFPAQYPLKPPDIYFMTPNGRFETRKKICLTMTSFHPDTWNPAWDVRTALTSLIAFMPTKGEGAFAAIDASDAERHALAIQSHRWQCSECNLKLPPDEAPPPADDGAPTFEAPAGAHSDYEGQPEPAAAQEQPSEPAPEAPPDAVPEDSIEEGADGVQRVNFEEMPSQPIRKKSLFMPLLDVPIVILFGLLLFLIANSQFNFCQLTK
jgi:ubiquitin-conjugating enzyme E2 J1